MKEGIFMSAPKGGNRLQKKSSGQKHWTLILFMVPGLVYLLINNYIPMAGILLAFKKVNYTLGIFKSPWCGLSNFKYLFKTKDAAIIFRNTVLYNLAFIVLGTAAAVATAILLGEVKKKKLLKIYQTSILLPHILSTAVIAYLAFAFLSKDSGFLNNAIIKPLGGDAISWYSKPKYWPYILTFIQLWRSVGYTTIMYYATLVGIDTSYYEAAVIDGASTWDQIRYITLPCLKTTIITLTIMNLGRMFYSDFGLFYQVPMNNGLLFNATNTLDTYVYRGLLELNDIGRASAACFIQSVLGFVLVWGANALTRKVDPDSAVF
jgi:putative aldouronate transport system permease protein